MTIHEIIGARGISETLHFTTNHGCLGTLYTGFLKSRARLEDDYMVKHLFEPNSSLRKDRDYLDYVNLSIESINTQFYGTSCNSWHRDKPIFWCILSFMPGIMAHDGVVFSTTNNIYSSTRRARGTEGLMGLFSQRIIQWKGNVVVRPEGLPPQYPTCFQAEVLYPGELSTEHLQKIYVRSQADQSEVIGYIKATLHRDVEVVVCPNKFGDRPV